MESRPARLAVTVVAAIDPNHSLTGDQIAAAFAHPQTTQRDSDFPGRFSTQVFADAFVVAKLRADLPLQKADPARWVHARLERERALRVYPRDRTWFIVPGDDGQWSAGTASLRRRPMHLLTTSEREATWEHWCRDFADLYLRAAEHGWRLDEGPSNFAWDALPDGSHPAALCYLDDDLYTWDNGRALALAMGVFAKRERWLGAEHAQAFAMALRDHLQPRASVMNLREFADDLGSGNSGVAFIDALSMQLIAWQRPKPKNPRKNTHSIALLGDIHSNLDALDAVLNQQEVRDAGTLLILGDTVGYGPDPVACVERLAQHHQHVLALRGNHDEAALHADAAVRFTTDAKWAIDWTRERLNQATRDWLSALPLEREGDGWLAVHGAPVDPQRMFAYVYQLTCEENFAALDNEGVALCFHGHTHIGGAWVAKRRPYQPQHLKPDAELDLSAYAKALVCPGSVGQPRDKLPGAAYAMFDTTARKIHFRRVPYDRPAVQARMAQFGFPPGLIRRLDGA